MFIPVAENWIGSDEAPTESDPASMETPGATVIAVLAGKVSKTAGGMVN